jgi:hypothetical protein
VGATRTKNRTAPLSRAVGQVRPPLVSSLRVDVPLVCLQLILQTAAIHVDPPTVRNAASLTY